MASALAPIKLNMVSPLAMVPHFCLIKTQQKLYKNKFSMYSCYVIIQKIIKSKLGPN